MAGSSATSRLRAAGQSLWLDNITRDLLDGGTLARYIDELSITGLTSNPTIYDRAISGTTAYDDEIATGREAGRAPEDAFFDLALSDLRRAADQFAPVYQSTGGVDGFVSLEVSPLLAYDRQATVREALRLHDLGGRPNLLIKIPGTPDGCAAVEEVIFAGVPVNVTLLFSPEQYVACMEAYTRGIERRVTVGRPAYVASVASVFVSRWDSAANPSLPDQLRDQLGLLMGRLAYAEYRRFFATDRWLRLANLGARPQRLLFASTGTKDPSAPDDRYVAGLAAPNTVNTMPEETLLAFADHGHVEGLLHAQTDGDADLVEAIAGAGVDMRLMAEMLQTNGAAAFVTSWTAMLAKIAEKLEAGQPVAGRAGSGVLPTAGPSGELR